MYVPFGSTWNSAQKPPETPDRSEEPSIYQCKSWRKLSKNCQGHWIGSHLRTLALKTENLSKKSVVLVNAEMDLVKRSSPYFSRVFCQGMVLVNPFLRFTRTTDLFIQIPGFKGKGSLPTSDWISLQRMDQHVPIN